MAQWPEPPYAGTSYEVSKRRPSSGSDAVETSDSDDDELVSMICAFTTSNTLSEWTAILLCSVAPCYHPRKGRCLYRGTRLKGARVLWELLTRKNYNSGVITKTDLNAYKRILVLTSDELVEYEPDGDTQISRGIK